MLGQKLWRVVGDEIHSKLAAHELRGRRVSTQQVRHFIDLGKSAAMNPSTQKLLVAVVMTVGIELEKTVADVLRLEIEADPRRLVGGVDAEPGQYPGEFLEIALRIPPVHAERMQFH